MSYQALYRKWRPNEFEEVKGQEHIVRTLKNQIKYGRVGHAYLFCGTRGTGKTTIARLLAKSVNCEHTVDGSPCNECESCRSISDGASMNVIEIDGASNNGVDNIRQINSSVQYSPSTGKYLVYIIDEVHMLRKEAFNALLKTLEEPPSYVIFILATTDVHSVPITILSRCQRYDFRRISIETITDRLAELLDRENIKAKREALAYVAKAADGSMRDALSILDQCISFNLGEELTYEKVLNTIGAVDVDIYIELLDAILKDNVSKAVNIIDDAVWQGKDLPQFIIEFIGFIRNVLMLKLDESFDVDLSEEKKKILIEFGKDVNEDYLINYINILQEASNKMPYVKTKRVVVDVAIIKMCKPQMQKDYSAIEKRLESLEKKTDNISENTKVVYVNADVESSTQMPTEKAAFHDATGDVAGDKDSFENNNSKPEDGRQIYANIKKNYPEANLKEIESIISIWEKLLKTVMHLQKVFLEKAKVVPGEMKSTIELVYEKNSENSLAIDYFEKKSNRELLEEEISELAGRDIHIGLRLLNKGDSTYERLSGFDLSKVKFDDIKINA
ncbi:MAG: DNA polymerase III subunit gamma/tau [Lachnospiraceae bacterium]|nr:DNA polymerase III subunit gamma/tau [Lachnospiraceae bacterium]